MIAHRPDDDEHDEAPAQSRRVERLTLAASAVHLVALVSGAAVMWGTGWTWPAYAAPPVALGLAAFVAWRARRWA